MNYIIFILITDKEFPNFTNEEKKVQSSQLLAISHIAS